MVDPFEGEQLGVRAQLDDALVDHGDLVGVLDGRQPVGDGDRGARLELVEPVQGSLHHLITRVGIIRGRRSLGGGIVTTTMDASVLLDQPKLPSHHNCIGCTVRKAKDADLFALRV